MASQNSMGLPSGFSQNTMAVLTTGGAGAVGVAQFIALDQLVDKYNGGSLDAMLSPLTNSVAKGLNKWATLASLIAGAGALSYVLYDVEMKRNPLSDTSLALGSYGIVSLTAGIVNAFLDPFGTSGATLNVGNLLKKAFSGISAPASKASEASPALSGRFVR